MVPPDNPGSAVGADAIPDGLQERDKWVCWRYEGQDKVPISPHNPNAGRISALDPIHWSDLETAYQTCKDHNDVAGIGYVFNTDAPIMGVDLDHCRVPETGAIQSWARDMIDTLDSYTEVSPSGTGVHVYVKADLPDGRNRSGNVEVYEGKRFFTVTGKHLEWTPQTLRRAQTAVNEVCHEYLADDTETRPNASSPHTATVNSPSDTATGGTNLSDSEVVEVGKQMDSRVPFAELWQGNWQNHYESHSEARLAFYNDLAFLTGEDPQQMWRVFQDSGLHPHPDPAKRPKCERLKDQETTIAIRDNNGVYGECSADNEIPSKSKELPADGGRDIVSDSAIKSVLE